MRTLNLLLIISLFIAGGCSANNDGKAGDDHVWKDQTDTIDRARGVEDMLRKSAEEKKRSVEQQGQ